MSNPISEKVDMSLDDIIKLTKIEKRKQTHLGNQRGRQNGITASGRVPRNGSVTNRRGSKGIVGHGVRHVINPVKQFHSSIQNERRGQGRGRGRGVNRQNLGVSPLNLSNIDQQNVPVRGRRNGRRSRGTGLVFTNTTVRQQIAQQQSYGQQQTVSQSQRLNKARQQALLLREKQLAIKNLQQAQKNVQSINLAIQKTARGSIVNQLRGLSNIQGNRQESQRKGRLPTSLKAPGHNNMVNNLQPTRQLTNTSVTINNPSALSSVVSGRKKRRWRNKIMNQPTSEHFTIQVANQDLQPVKKLQPSILNQLKSLKPAVSTTYTFQKNVFAAPSTGLSLNDRFSGTTSTEAEERQVFI